MIIVALFLENLFNSLYCMLSCEFLLIVGIFGIGVDWLELFGLILVFHKE